MGFLSMAPEGRRLEIPGRREVPRRSPASPLPAARAGGGISLIPLTSG